ncbi:MAG: SIMPL domain-containing protein [Gemmatimonadaceae bacterium]
MRLFISSLVVGSIVFSATQIHAQVPVRNDARPDINTMGRGEIRVAPDRATVLVSIETHASTAAAASSANSQITNATIKAVKAAAGPQDLVTTQSFSVTPDYQKGKPSGFGARNTIRAELRDIARLGPVIDASLTAGATQISQVQFTSSTASEVRKRALKLAVAEARADAETLADAAGGSVGRLLSVSTGPSNISNSRLATAMVMGGVARAAGYSEPPPIIPDDLTISTLATTRWEFIPRRNP